MNREPWTIQADLAEICGGPHDGTYYLVPPGRNSIIIFGEESPARAQVIRDMKRLKEISKILFEPPMDVGDLPKTRPEIQVGEVLEITERLHRANPYLYIREATDGRSDDKARGLPLKVPEAREQDLAGAIRHKFRMATREQYDRYFKHGDARL